jgi:hypothetical protein
VKGDANHQLKMHDKRRVVEAVYLKAATTAVVQQIFFFNS